MVQVVEGVRHSQVPYNHIKCNNKMPEEDETEGVVQQRPMTKVMIRRKIMTHLLCSHRIQWCEAVYKTIALSNINRSISSILMQDVLAQFIAFVNLLT